MEAQGWRGVSVEVDGDERGDPLLWHRDAVEAVRDLHRQLVVRDHQDLGVGDGLLDEAVEQRNVGEALN